MDVELFIKWINKHSFKTLRPLLLILDGYGSHLDIDMIDFLAENQIHLFCLPPHTTNILQPLDVKIFCPLKTYFSRITDMIKLALLSNKQLANV